VVIIDPNAGQEKGCFPKPSVPPGDGKRIDTPIVLLYRRGQHMPYVKYNFSFYFQIVTTNKQKPCADFNRLAAPVWRPIKYGRPKTSPVDYSSRTVIDTRIHRDPTVPGDATRDQNGDRWLPF
jgi:hypothetical protein